MDRNLPLPPSETGLYIVVYALPPAGSQRNDWVKARVVRASYINGVYATVMCSKSKVRLDGFMTQDGSAVLGTYPVPKGVTITASQVEAVPKQARKLNPISNQYEYEWFTPEPTIWLHIQSESEKIG